jgi:hypothetical protein
MHTHSQVNREIEYVPLVVREPFRQEIISYQGQSTQEPKSCGCCSQGRVGLQAVFDSKDGLRQRTCATRRRWCTWT